jgi:hypothetical protein
MRWKLLFVPVVAVMAWSCGGGAPAGPPVPFKPVADTKTLMSTVIDTNADVIWNSVASIITANGIEERRPRTDEEWASARSAAMVVAESGNLLMMAPRARDSGEWMKAAQALVETGTAAVQAAEKKDADQLFTVGGEIYGACSNCHVKYIDAIREAEAMKAKK